MLLHMSLQCQPMTNYGENGQIYCWLTSWQAAFFSNLNAVHIAISPDTIVPRITCCTTRCSFMHPTVFLWKRKKLGQSVHHLAIRYGKFPFLSGIRDVRRKELCMSFIDFIWIKESSCMYEPGCNVSISWTLHEVKVHQPCSVDGKMTPGIILPRAILTLFVFL